MPDAAKWRLVGEPGPELVFPPGVGRKTLLIADFRVPAESAEDEDALRDEKAPEDDGE